MKKKAVKGSTKPKANRLIGRQQKMVSVPAGVYELMANYPDVNWSEVACRAFEVKLGELSSMKVEKNMKDVVARLRASKIAADSEGYQAGFSKGEKWASEDAEVHELRRLEKLKATVQYWDDWFEINGTNAYASHELLYSEIAGYERPDRSEAAEFFDYVGANEEDMYDPAYVRGFAEGALSVWDDVKEQI